MKSLRDHSRRSVLVWLWVLTVSAAAPATAQTGTLEQPAAQTDQAELGKKWVQLKLDENQQPVALEVAIVRYVRPKYARMPADKVPEYVDLVGAVHIGDKKYYDQLNRRFRTYDALLYELVAPQGTVVEKGRGTSNTNPLGAMQNGLKTILDIEHQLERIDYTRPNFVHADFSPDEFMKSMENRNESFVQLYFRLIGQALAQQSQQAAQGQSADVDIMSALLSQDRPRMLKIALAKQFQSLEEALTSLSGPEGSTLITERNKRALEVLRRQQQRRKRKIGIFYGAGHLSDMSNRLEKQFGLVPMGIEWLEAWDLRPK
jgi:hypothetical protein